MNSKVSECLKAARISKVVWIDDYFASPSRTDLEQAILKAVVALKERGEKGADLATFGKVDLSLSTAELEDATVDLCEPLSDEQFKEILAALGVLTGATEVPSQADLSPEEFQQLRTALGPALRQFSLGAWTSAGVTEFGAAREDTLFLVDKEFSREDAGSDGIEVLEFLVKNTQGLCIMLTHTCKATDQEQRRMEFANSKGLLPHSFCVVSKQQNPELSVDDRFAMAIRTVMTHKFNGGIAYTISETIQASANETAKALTSQSVPDLERVLFQNADEEGVFEYDAVLRIFEIQQRHALNRALAEDGIQRQLQLSRRFREAIDKLEINNVPGDMGYFRGIRAREVFFDGTGLNKLHSPISCGDVFETERGERYVLLAQPCDLMVRKGGDRRAEVGLLALISEPKKPDHGELEEPRSVPDYRYYDLKDAFGKEKKSFVDFQKMFVVNLAVLDLAAFNSDGSVQLRSDQPDPSIVLSKGWDLLFRDAKRRLFPKGKPPLTPSFGIGKRATRLAGTVSGDLLRYPIRRIGRLQSGTGTAILAAWATFQTRSAFDHDFARGSESYVPTEAQPTPAPANAEPAVAAKAENVTPTTPAKAESPKLSVGTETDSSASASLP